MLKGGGAMKLISTNGNRVGGGLIRQACGASCRKIRAQIAGVKEAFFAEASRAFSAPEQLVRLALNEAEAAAWQTKYPHLFFPTLAAEKIREVADWNAHQQSVRQNGRVITLTA
jgi:hypothetical protein